MGLKQLSRLALLVVSLAILIIIWLAGRGELPGFILWLYNFPGGDKVGHFLLFGLLSFLLNFVLAARTAPVLRRRVLLGSVLAATAVTLEETSQLFLARRSFSLLDLCVTYAGIFVLGHLGARLYRLLQSRPA